MLIIASARTCLNCPDRVTSTSQCKLRIGPTEYVTMTRTELISAPASWTQCVCQRFSFISLLNFNQLDSTSKVMYRHEIICTGNKAYSINNYLFQDNAVAASLETSHLFHKSCSNVSLMFAIILILGSTDNIFHNMEKRVLFLSSWCCCRKCLAVSTSLARPI